MCIGVYLHVDFLVESLAAVLANERLVVGVSSHVGMEVGCTIEGLCIKRAFILSSES